MKTNLHASATDKAAEAIRGARQLAEQLVIHSEAQREILSRLRDHLSNAHLYVHCTPASEALLRRIKRIEELRRMQECASFQIEASTACQELWEKLP